MEFDEYVAARGQAMLRLARVLTGDQHAAEDLAQAALADVLRHWASVRRADHPDAYVRRAMLNRYLSGRRRRAHGELVLADVTPLQRGVEPDVGVAVADRDEVRRLLGALPPRARAVLVLRYYEDLDDNAIATALGVSASTVRSTASRALASLRPQLALGVSTRKEQ